MKTRSAGIPWLLARNPLRNVLRGKAGLPDRSDETPCILASRRERHVVSAFCAPKPSDNARLIANLELAVIVFAAAEPRPDLWKLDRFLVLAEDAELESLILLNKADLATSEEIEEYAAGYRRIGYDVLAVSAHAGIGIEPLREKLKGHISAFCGPSGVGKSSLLNAVQPGLALKTSDIGYTTFKGRHTTVATELLPLTFGGWVADTPGLRQVEFWDLPTEDVAFSFPEMEPLIGQCKFADCRHRQEPGCAIRAAVEAGAIETRRYESYLEMTK